MRQKLSTAFAATALVVAVFGVTPLGHAAANVVKRALFANNAGKVNGIKASSTPQPNQLLPLGPDAKFPTSVIPQGTAGGGGSGMPGPDSVGGDQVRDGSLTGADIKDGSITGAKLADKTITAKQIDESTLPFQRTSDAVRMFERNMPLGTDRFFDIGPYLRVSASCFASANGSHHLLVSLLNNAPGNGLAEADDTRYFTPSLGNQGYVTHVTQSIDSGASVGLSESNYPSSGQLDGFEDSVSLIWNDSGETVTGVYYTYVSSFCEIVGSLTRTT
jgi:hypothetical protein